MESLVCGSGISQSSILLLAAEEAAAREGGASSLQPVLLMACLQSLCKPLSCFAAQPKQSLCASARRAHSHFGSDAVVAAVIDSQENLCGCF